MWTHSSKTSANTSRNAPKKKSGGHARFFDITFGSKLNFFCYCFWLKIDLYFIITFGSKLIYFYYYFWLKIDSIKLEDPETLLPVFRANLADPEEELVLCVWQ